MRTEYSGLHDKCAVFGIWNHPQASQLAYLGLYAQQHRGEESSGIVSSQGKRFYTKKAMGLVPDVFTPAHLKRLKGNRAVGHVRYSTTGSSQEKNVQPFMATYRRDAVAIAHNGNLVNAHQLRLQLEQHGSIFQTSMDTEVIAHLLARSKLKKFEDNLFETLNLLRGAFTLTMLTPEKVVGVRDPNGFRPLVLGKLGKSFVLASETCALDLLTAEFVREIEPGEIVVFDRKGMHSYHPFPKQKPSYCIFEMIYFARPDSHIFGDSVYYTRKRLGEELYREYPAKADMVMAIPDSGNYAAMGYSAASGLPFEAGMIRNHYIGRTFIQPLQMDRDFKVRVKLNPIRDVLRGKRIIVVEDSIVRGTTSRTRVRALREAGAREIHMMISCPPIISPCHYGIDFPTQKELIASSRSVEEIRKFLELDSLSYLSLEGMLRAMKMPADHFCAACFTGTYPVAIEGAISKDILEKKTKCHNIFL